AEFKALISPDVFTKDKKYIENVKARRQEIYQVEMKKAQEFNAEILDAMEKAANSYLEKLFSGISNTDKNFKNEEQAKKHFAKQIERWEQFFGEIAGEKICTLYF